MSGFYINSIRGRHCQQKQTIAGRIEQHAAWEDENLIFITNRKCVMVLMIGRINECCECCCSTAGVADAVLLYETGWFNSGSSNQTKSLFISCMSRNAWWWWYCSFCCYCRWVYHIKNPDPSNERQLLQQHPNTISMCNNWILKYLLLMLAGC